MLSIKHVLASKVLARKKFFRIWEKINFISLLGMNIGPVGGFEDDGEEYVMNFIRDNSIGGAIIDAGANVGEYTERLLKYFDEKSIYSFEPLSSTFRTLKCNLGESRAKLINMALGEKDEMGIIYYDKDDSTLSSLYQRDLRQYNTELTKTEEIQITSLDSFCEKEGINHISFLKMDVEGNEIRLLKGASNLLNNLAIDFIQFEFGGANVDSRTFFRDFWEMLHDRYEFNYIMRDGFIPIKQYTEQLEQFSMANYFLISKGLKNSQSKEK